MTDARAVLLGDVCKFVGGGTPSRAQSKYFQGDIPWATVKDFKTFLIQDTEEHISELAIADSATNIINPGTVLLVTRVGLGKVAIAGCRLAINQDVKAITPTDDVLPEFLFWFLLAKANDIKQMGAGATVKGVTLNDIKSITMPLPTIAEQLRIVDILSRANGIVQLRREAEKKAAELIPALFLDMFGDPATNPKGLPTKAIKDICDLVRGSSPRPQGDLRYFCGPVPRLMIADITRDGVYVLPKIDSLTVEGAKKSRPMKTGEVVMAVSGAVGLPAILSVDACIHDGFVGFRSLSDEVSSEYFYNFLAAYRRLSIGQAVGATFQNLKTDQVRAWLVPLPTRAKQAEFNRVAADMRSLEKQQAVATATAQAIFDALLAQVFAKTNNVG
jgi:restriction endonuclease S subunit